MSHFANDREHPGRDLPSSGILPCPGASGSAGPERITLAELLRRSGPLSEALTARIGRRIARELAVRHATGTFHGDLSPESVTLLCDGGLDSIELVGGGAASVSERREKLEFRSPEQLAGRPAGPASDLYALGALLFFALTGHPPFQGAPRDLVKMHLVETAPSVAGLSPHRVGSLMNGLVRDCLAKRPGARPASAADLTAVLGSLSLPSGPAREPQGTDWARAADRWGRPRPRRLTPAEQDSPVSHVGVVVRRMVATLPPPAMDVEHLAVDEQPRAA